MNYLKNLLETLTKSERYFAEMSGNIAEIYVDSDDHSVVLLEFDGEVFHLNFRCDLISQAVAQITYDITMIDADIIIGADFFSTPETGIVYGEKALTLYFAGVGHAFEQAKAEQEEEINSATYIVEEPICGYGAKQKPSKYQEMWGVDFE